MMELLFFGAALDDPLVSRLGPRARAWVEEGRREDVVVGGGRRAAYRARWPGMRKLYDAMAAVADAPAPRREPVMEDVQRQLQELAGVEDETPSWIGYARRLDAARVRLDALLLTADARAFREARGRWPRDGAELAEWLPASAPERASIPALRIEPAASGRVVLVLPLPEVEGDEGR